MGNFIFNIQMFANINNAVNDTLVIGTNGNDAITNSGEYAIVNGGKGNIPFAVRQIMLSL